MSIFGHPPIQTQVDRGGDIIIRGAYTGEQLKIPRTELGAEIETLITILGSLLAFRDYGKRQ